MREHSESRVVPYSAELMYRVVADVEHYPQFLPWVTALRMLPPGDGSLAAEMLVGFGPFRERYTSRIVLDPAGLSVDVTAIKGPFRRLENRWRFTPLPGGEEAPSCRIDFFVAFEFSNPLLQAAAAQAFEKVLGKMTDAFVARAEQLSR